MLQHPPPNGDSRTPVKIAAILLLLLSTACGRSSSPGDGTHARIEISAEELRAVTPDGRVLRRVFLTDTRAITPEGEEQIEKDYVLSAGFGAAWAGVYGYRYAGPQGGGWTEKRAHRFTYYDSQLQPLWSGSEVGGDPLGGDIRFGDSGRVVLFVNRAENLEDERLDSGSQPFIVARDAGGRVLFEKRGSSSGSFNGGVAISNSGKYLAYGEASDGALTVIDLTTGRTGATSAPPAGGEWESVMLSVGDDGGIRSRIQGLEGEEDWEGRAQW
jgi:hypothetical protein